MKKRGKIIVAVITLCISLMSSMSAFAGTPGPHDGYNWFGIDRAFGWIYNGQVCVKAQDKKYFEDGSLLNDIIEGMYRPEAIEMLLDYGYFTEYVDIFRQQGYIPASYQLPKTYYTMVKTKNVLFTNAYGTKEMYIITDCPEAQAEFNRYAQVILNVKPVPPLLGNSYVPKYLREQALQK